MRVSGVDEHRHPRLLTQPFGEADVIAVAVGEDETADVAERAADGLEFVSQVVPVPGQPGIDERDALGQIDQVRGDDVVAQSVQVRCELHGVPFGVVMATIHSYDG